MRRTLLLLVLVWAASMLRAPAPAVAQDSGSQLWVQAFEDRNGNGTRDAGEPFLTRGVSVDLLNSDGVVMASGTLDGAPFASQGFIGFQYLQPGTYTVVISSPDLTPTTPDRVDVPITAGEAPVTVSYGAQRAAPADTTPASGVSSLMNGELARLALSGFGAAVVIGVMIVLGLAVYALVLRRRYQLEMQRYTTTSTGSLRAVRVPPAGEGRETSELFRGGARRTLETYRLDEEENEEV